MGPRVVTGVLFAAAITLGSFQLFSLQPLIGRVLLPWFGAAPGVWTTCMLFFQALLLGGYAYADVLSARMRPRTQALVHAAVLAIAVALLPITPDDRLRAAAEQSPTLAILLTLLVAVGGPYLALASGSPLLQRWYTLAPRGAATYRLYALANAGSLAALVAYPTLVEPRWSLGAQAELWAQGFVVYAALGLVICLSVWTCKEASVGDRGDARGPSPGDASRTPPAPALWIGLSMCASVVLLAATNQLSQDVAVSSLTWTAPLGLYLLSWILCFASERLAPRRVLDVALAVGLVWVTLALLLGPELGLAWQVGGHALALFSACMLCHGELYRLRPGPALLTRYYLYIAAGGAAGGVLVGVVAPAIEGLASYWEYPLALALCPLLVLAARRRGAAPSRSTWLLKHVTIPLAALLAAPALGWELRLADGAARLQRVDDHVIDRGRNFFGVLRVVELDRERRDAHHRALVHGRISHGTQLLARRQAPTSYFGPDSGPGLAISLHPRRRVGAPLRIGVLGLGVGTVAAHARAGDVVRFYEVNPLSIRYADEHFSFLADARARGVAVEVELGDARVALERSLRAGAPGRFDVLVVDAFSGDAPPVHLLTRESMAVYRAHMAGGGVLAFNVSNRFVDLEPVVLGLAADARLPAVSIADVGGGPGLDASDWVLVSDSRALLERDEVMFAESTRPRPRGVLWTDEHGSLVGLLRLTEAP